MRTADIPRVRTTLAGFRVSAIVTGVFLLLLVVMMVSRYGLGADIELAGPEGFLALTPKDLIAGVNLSTIILIAHGWLYVVYLGLDFILWPVHPLAVHEVPLHRPRRRDPRALVLLRSSRAT